MTISKIANKVIKVTLNTTMVTSAVVASTSVLSLVVCIVVGSAIVEGACDVINKL